MQERDVAAQISGITYTQIWTKKGPIRWHESFLVHSRTVLTPKYGQKKGPARWHESFLVYSRTALWCANSTADPLGSTASLAIIMATNSS